MIAGSAVGSSMCHPDVATGRPRRARLRSHGVRSPVCARGARDAGIVNRRLADAIFFGKRNRISTHRLFARHGGHNTRRIQTRTQERAIGTSLTICCSTDAQNRSRIFIRQIRFGSLEGMIRRRKRQIPILFDSELAVLPKRIVPRWQLEDSLKHRERIGHPEEGQVFVERFRSCSLQYPALRAALYLGSKCQFPAAIAVIKRLDPK